MGVRRMGRLGKVAFLLALFVLLGALQGTRAQYDEDDYGYEDYDESDYDYDESVGESGWRLIWETVDGEGEVEETLSKFGVLTSPNYPEDYPSSHDSEQEIRVAE